MRSLMHNSRESAVACMDMANLAILFTQSILIVDITGDSESVVNAIEAVISFICVARVNLQSAHDQIACTNPQRHTAQPLWVHFATTENRKWNGIDRMNEMHECGPGTTIGIRNSRLDS